MSRPRLLGASLEPLNAYREEPTRTSGLFVELERLFPLAGFVRPTIHGPGDWAAKARAFYPNRDAWRGRAWLSPLAFRLRTDAAEEQLVRRDGEYDLIVQLQTLFAPGTQARPYVIYTDNTYTQTRRFYRAWAPLGIHADQRWRELEKRTFRQARAVFGMSRWVCEAIVDDYNCDPSVVIPVGAGANSLASPSEGKSYGRRIALFVGNKYELKGVPTLLEAWTVVRERLPDALLWIVGVDPPRGVRERFHSVEWFGYVADRRQLDQLYVDASVFVLPTQFEAYGHVVVEAMGSGLPCVTTNVGALPELVDQGVTGLLVPPREPAALAEALISLLTDPVRAEKMGRAGQKKVVEQLTWRAVAERMAPYLEAAVDHR
ncbi:MAG TPA: glycosyltransferase family 4 protein [Gaiellaceae bacterium]|nr:glycosyltransferase family 4 protein [Gaiellaceae bacterium]